MTRIFELNLNDGEERTTVHLDGSERFAGTPHEHSCTIHEGSVNEPLKRVGEADGSFM